MEKILEAFKKWLPSINSVDWTHFKSSNMKGVSQNIHNLRDMQHPVSLYWGIVSKTNVPTTTIQIGHWRSKTLSMIETVGSNDIEISLSIKGTAITNLTQGQTDKMTH